MELAKARRKAPFGSSWAISSRLTPAVAPVLRAPSAPLSQPPRAMSP